MTLTTLHYATSKMSTRKGLELELQNMAVVEELPEGTL